MGIISGHWLYSRWGKQDKAPDGIVKHATHIANCTMAELFSQEGVQTRMGAFADPRKR